MYEIIGSMTRFHLGLLERKPWKERKPILNLLREKCCVTDCQREGTKEVIQNDTLLKFCWEHLKK